MELPSHEGLRGWHTSQHITHSSTRCQHLRARTPLAVSASELSPCTFLHWQWTMLSLACDELLDQRD